MRPLTYSTIFSIIVGVFIFTSTSFGQQPRIALVSLHSEYLENPSGIDESHPRLTWILNSMDRGVAQTAYQVLVATSEDKLGQDAGDMWDSKKVLSDQSVLVPYGGVAFYSGQRVFWKVRIWDQSGESTSWSPVAQWTVGVIPGESWRGKWIAAGEAEHANRAGRGYHAGETAQNETKWVQVDLGASVPISSVQLDPMRHEGKDGFGFPVRFTVEASDDPNFANATPLADYTKRDFANPGIMPVKISMPAAKPVEARYVRVTATHLWQRNPTAWCFALDQLEVISDGKNIAQGKEVTAKDSVENYGWAKASLTDGIGGTEPRADSLLLRRDFEVKPNLRRATMFICGLGYYELSINGSKIGTDVLSPGWSKYDKTCLYDTRDVTGALKAGTNAAGLFLGNSMYNVAGSDRYNKFTGSFGPPKAIAQLRLEYANGDVEWISTDDSWRTSPGPVTFNSVYGGEDYDARLMPVGWASPGFYAGNWHAAAVVAGPGGELRGLSCAAQPMMPFEVFKPVNVSTLSPGVTVYDLGQNAAQMPRITVSGPAGASVKIWPAELTKSDGSIDQGSTGGPTYCTYHLSGAGKEAWSPRFFYSGYRYLQVECTPAAAGGALPVVEQLESVVVHSASAVAGEFSCSNDLFNRTYTLIRWAQRSNMVSVLSDCPHREKLGWLEQTHLNGPALRYNFDLAPFFSKIMNDMADSQTPAGLIPSIAPEYVKFGGDFRDSPEWGSAFLLVAWQQYEFTGDAELLRRYYPAMQRYVAYLGGKAQNNIISYGLSDWYDIGPGEPGYSKLTPKGVTATAFYFEDATILARTAQLLGNAEDATKYTMLAADIRTAFNSKFLDRTTHQYAKGSQCGNALPLVMGITPPEDRAAVLQNIVDDIQTHGLTAGDVGYRYLLRALAEGGRSDVIFTMNNQSDKPGYGYQLKKGATSLTEAWDANRNSSQNHFMLGQINEWFFHDLAGIQSDPQNPGFKSVIIRPAIVGDLTFVRAAYDCPYGTIRSEWKRTGETVAMNVTIPANTTATIMVPAVNGESVIESSRPFADSPGVKFISAGNGVAIYKAGSGAYVIHSKVR